MIESLKELEDKEERELKKIRDGIPLEERKAIIKRVLSWLNPMIERLKREEK